MMSPILGARKLRRAAAQAIITAATGVAMFSPGDAAYGATFTFTTDLADMRDPNAWTPNGIPGAADLAFIKRRGAGDNTNVDFTLNAGDLNIGAIEYDTSRSRNLYNATPSTTSNLTLSGLAGHSLIQMNLTGGTFGFIGSQPSGGTLNLILAGSGDVSIATTSFLNITAGVSGAGSIRKVGAGTLLLGGSNSFTGALEAHSGPGRVVLDFSNNPGPKIGSSGSLVFTGGDVFQNGNATQDVSNTVAGTYINSGQSVLRVDVSGAGQMSSTLNAGQFHRSKGAYLNINYTLNASIPASIPRVIATNTNVNGMIGAWLNVGNNDWAVNDGSNNIIPMPAGSYAAKDNPSTWSTNDNITQSTSFSGTLPASVTINSLRLNTSGTQTVTIASGQTLTIDSGGILVTGTAGGTSTFSGGNITTGTQLPDELVAIIGGGKTLTINSTIVNNASTSLTFTKLGSGTTVLGGANTFTGGIILDTGTINAMGIQPAGTASALGKDGLISMGGPNSVLLVGSTNFSGSMNFNRNFQFNEGNQTLQINAVTAGATISLGGTVTGTGGVTKGGSATSALVISGTRDFSGAVTSNSGIISVDTMAPIGTPSGLGTGTLNPVVTIGSGNGAGTLEFTGTAPNSTTDRTLAIGTGLPNGGSINLVMTQPVTLTWNGDMQWNSGLPASINGGSIAFATTTANNPRPFRLDTPGTIIFNGSIGGNSATTSFGQLQKFGTGTVILGGSNSYLLGTSVNAGTLITNTNFSQTGYTLGSTTSPAVTNVGATQITGLFVASGAVAVVSQKSANNDPSGTTAIPWNSTAATSGGLQVAGRLDLNNNAMLIYGEGTPGDMSSIIRIFLKNGHDAGWGSGTPTGGAIVSSSAKNSPAGHKTALGYARASDLGLAVGGDFHGATIANSTDTLIAYVLEGDANLDGVVNALDFNALATGYGQNNGTQIWANGDFNYDSTTNTLDFNALASNFNMTTPIPSPGAALGTLVPEPTAIAVVALAGVGLRRMRRGYRTDRM